MKNSVDLGECYLPRPSASVDNTLDLQNSSYPIQPHSITTNYELWVITVELYIIRGGGGVTGFHSQEKWFKVNYSNSIIQVQI